MFVFDCEAGYQPDNGQNDVTDGSVENYDFDWGQPLDCLLYTSDAADE